MVFGIAHKADRERIDVTVFFGVPLRKHIWVCPKKGVIFIPAKGAWGSGVQLYENGALPFMTFATFPKNRL